MILRPNSGVARISAMWLIVLVVLFLASIAFAFVAQGDRSAERDLKVEAREAARVAEARFQVELERKNQVSEVLGYFPAEAVDKFSNVEDAKAGIARLRDVFTDITPTDTTYESLINKMIAAYNAQASAIAERDTRIRTLEGEVQTTRASVDAITADKNEKISALETELADETQNAAQRQQELEDRLETANSNTAERDTELRTAQADLSAQRREWNLERQRYEAQINELARGMRFAKEPFSLYPDGKILEVSGKLPIAWINVGANHRLTRGTRFQVESGTPGSKRFKAWAEVIRVEADRAEVTLTDLVDRFDPVVAGDTIINPLYDPTGGRNAVLCGRFSGAFNERELTLLLERMGIVVQPGLELTTHFLIVGSELWADPETDEPLDDPIQPSELAIYKEAEAKGVQIIPLQDIRAFFRVDSSVAGN